MAKIELTLVRQNFVGGIPVKIMIDGSLVDFKMILGILEDGIDKCNENLENKYDLF